MKNINLKKLKNDHALQVLALKSNQIVIPSHLQNHVIHQLCKDIWKLL